MRRAALLLAFTALTVLLANGVALAYPGDLDPNFGGDGRVVTDFAPPEDPRDDGASDVVVQPDGKIVAAGDAQTMTDFAFALARYNADGSLDTSFGTGGRVTTDVTVNSNDRVVAIGLQSDGKIIVAGESYSSSSGNKTFVVARYTVDGSLDTAFGDDGFARMAFDCCSSALSDVAIQTDDKIVVGGTGNGGDFLLARYGAGGTLDDTFDQDGVARTDLNPGVDDWQTSVSDLAIQSDGKIVAVGSTNPGNYTDFGLARYNTDGSLDTSFDQDGKLVSYITSRDDAAYDVVIQGDGKIVAAGEANRSGGLARYNPDGSFDTSFGTGGKVVASGTAGIREMALQQDGKIMAATDYSYEPLVRFEPDGRRDASLDSASGGSVMYNASLALQADGKAVLAGLTTGSDFYDFKLARYMGAYPDTTRPKGSVIIDGGNSVTRDRIVKLALKATDPWPYSSGVSKMRIKNAGGTWSKWVPYATRKDWSVSRGGGKKTVYVQYLDLMGNVSAAAMDSITYKP